MDRERIPTATVITAVARQTEACRNHGDIVSMVPYDGSVMQGGQQIRVRLYETRFDDGTVKTFWMRDGIPVGTNR
jgi:hypothetical protein